MRSAAAPSISNNCHHTATTTMIPALQQAGSCRRTAAPLGSTSSGRRCRVAPNAHARPAHRAQQLPSPVQRQSSSGGQLATAAASASPVVGAAARPPTPSIGPVEYEAGGSSYRVSHAGQLLRLQEQSQDSYEYALLVPASMASVLCDVLHRAVACIQGGNEGRPLDLHHHVLQGSRTFSCSLSFTPPPSGQAASVTVTVQEAGRSCVDLAVSTAALPAIQQLLHMLQQVAAGVAAASSQDTLQQDGADAAPAAQLQTADSDEAAASSMQEASSTALVTGAAEPEEPAGATTAPAMAAQAAEVEAPAAAEQEAPAAAEGDASASAAPAAAAAAAVDAAAAAAGLTGAEVLFAGILESSSLQEGLRFAQAATAEALGDSSGGPERMFHLAHLCLLWQKAPEYAAAQQRQARGLGDDVPEAEVLMPGVPLDAGVRRDVQAFVGMLCPLLQRQLAQLPRHILQRILRCPHKVQAQLPGSFLAAWADAAAGPSARGSWDTPGLQAWLDATQQLMATGQQQQQEEPGQQPLPASHSVLPLQWAVEGLQEAASSMRAHVLGGLMQESQLPLLQQQVPQQALLQAAGEEDLEVLQQLVPLLLAAVGHQLGRQQLLWQPWPTHKDQLQHDVAAVLRELLCSGVQLQLQLEEQDLLAEQPREVLEMQRRVQEQLQQRMQQLVVAHVNAAPAEQHCDAMQLVWGWLAAGGGAAQLSSSELAALLELLPFDDAAAAAAHSTVTADGGTATRTPTSLLGTVLLQHAQGGSGSTSRGAAAALVGLCFRALQPYLAAARPGGEHLPTELLCAAAQLSEAHLAGDCGLQPRWAADSRHGQSSSSYAWAAFEPLVVSTAEAAGSSTAVTGTDAAAQCVALLLLGVAPSQLLQAYIGAVGPDALSLDAPGLCDLLWVLGGIMQHGLTAETGSSRAGLLRLAHKACSSLAVRSASAVSTRQLARATWGVAELAATSGFAAPQQMLAWLQRSWLQPGGELVARVQQLQAADAEDLTRALQQLRLLPEQQRQEQEAAAVEQQQPSRQATVPEPAPAVPAADAAAAPGSAVTPPAAAVDATVVHQQQRDDERQDAQQQGEAEQQHHHQQQEQQDQSDSQQPVPPSVAELLQQIRAGGFRPTQKQALQQLLPVQQHMTALSAADALCCVQACFQHSVPVSGAALLAAAAAAAKQQEEGPLPVRFLLQLLSAMASSMIAAGSSQHTQQLRQEAPLWLPQLLPLTDASLAGLSAAELLDLLRDVHTLATGAAPPKAATLPIGSALFGTAAVSSSDGRSGSAASSTAPAAAAVDRAWLAAVAAALEPKLLLLPHGSQVLQCLQLLQGLLGLQQPAGTFVARALAAADALLDTFSGRGCLELLAAAAAAGRMPSQAQTTAILQHLVPLKLSPSEVAGGCRLLAALSIRPPVELLAHWFDITQAAAERLTPAHVQQLLWSCCVWQVLPPSEWLDAVLRALAPAGRLSACTPATAAGICRSLWQLGVQPAPGFVAAVVAAAQHAMATQGSSLAYDAESLSVLCHCLLMWRHESTPAWRAAVEQQAAAAMPTADGPSLLRLGIYLTNLASRQQDEQQQQQQEEGLDDEGLLPWQQSFVDAASGLLPADQQEAQLGAVQAAGGAGLLQLVPAWGLVILGGCLDGMPSSSLPLLRALARAVQTEASLEQLTAWDLTTLLPALLELGVMLEQQAEETQGPMASLLVRQLEQEAAALSASGQALVKQAYQQRAGAPSVALMMIPALAGAFRMDMPAQSTANLEASVAAAQAREQALQQALRLQQGGPAVPDHLLQGLDELLPHDGEQLQAAYADNPVAAAVTRRMQLLGAAVSDGFVLASLAGSS